MDLARLLDYLDRLDRWSRYVVSICVDGTIGPTVHRMHGPSPRDIDEVEWDADDWDATP